MLIFDFDPETWRSTPRQATTEELRLVARFEQETGLMFHPDGPMPWACEKCGGLAQFVYCHDCTEVARERCQHSPPARRDGEARNES